MTAIGKANYEGYREFNYGKSAVTGDPIPEWDKLPVHIQSGWDAGADAVDLVLAECPADEDAPGSEPARVVVVTGVPGPAVAERRYAARGWEDCDDGRLHVFDRKGRCVATYPKRTWLSVREDGAEVPDATARALGTARRALSEIVKRSEDGGEQPFGRPEIGRIARGALEEIWTETEG